MLEELSDPKMPPPPNGSSVVPPAPNALEDCCSFYLPISFWAVRETGHQAEIWNASADQSAPEWMGGGGVRSSRARGVCRHHADTQ